MGTNDPLMEPLEGYNQVYKELFKKNAEEYLVSIGEITSEEDEEEYANKYYGKHIDKTIRNTLCF